MRSLANILWHIPLLGFISAFYTFLVGLLFIISIVGAPIGLGLIQLSKFLMMPFTHDMVDKQQAHIKQNILWKSYSFIVRVVYFPFGLVLAAITIIQVLGLCLSIIGIPNAIVLAKSLGTIFNPVHKVCIPQHRVAYA